MTLKNNRAPLLYYIKLCASFQSHGWIKTEVTVQKRSIRVKMGFFVPCDLEILQMTLKNKLCATFHSHWWILNGVTVPKRSLRIKIGFFLSRVSLKFDRWPWKTIGHLSYAVSSFVHHFIVIGKFKLELQSGNVQFRSKSMIFLSVWPWNLKDDIEKQ